MLYYIMENLSNTIKRRFDHEASRQALKEKYEAKLIFAHQGGMFRAGPELIVLLNSLTQEEPVIVDLYDMPITVNKQTLLEETVERWQEQLNAWQVELAELSRER
jgi:hypothetical protein